MTTGDDGLEIEGTAVFEKGKLRDFTKVNVVDGEIHYKLYQQDGTFQHMRCKDTLSNHLYVSWMQIHDRYTPRAT